MGSGALRKFLFVYDPWSDGGFRGLLIGIQRVILLGITNSIPEIDIG